MFKIVKIFNSGTAVPETVKLDATAATAYSRGAAVTVTSGKAAACGATTAPSFIIAQDHAADAGDTVLAYPVTADTVFEVPVGATPTSLAVGNAVTLNIVDGQAVGVTATTASGVATILDLQGAAASGDLILVRFLG